MKSMIAILSALFILLLAGCSNMEQESFPVAPELNKMVSEPLDPSGTYPYLQHFKFVPVESFHSSTTPGTIEVVIPSDKFPKIFNHMFAVLEYEDFKAPILNNMIFIGRPLTNVFNLNGIETKYLKNIKLYTYNSEDSWKGIAPPYNYMTSFHQLRITNWSDNGSALVIYTNDWSSNVSDTFLEIRYVNQSHGSENILTYVAKPSAGKIAVPKIVKGTITGLKMYALFDDMNAY